MARKADIDFRFVIGGLRFTGARTAGGVYVAFPAMYAFCQTSSAQPKGIPRQAYPEDQSEIPLRRLTDRNDSGPAINL